MRMINEMHDPVETINIVSVAKGTPRGEAVNLVLRQKGT